MPVPGARSRRSTCVRTWSVPARSSLLLVVLLDGALERRERLAPELVEVAAKRIHPVRIELIDPPSPVSLIHNQPGRLEHLQMLRHGGSTDRPFSGQLADSARTFGEPFEDRAPGWIGERCESIGSVRHCLP